MIRHKEPRVSQGENRLEEIESFGRARLDEPVPGKIAGRKVPGVELGELAYVERDALPRFRPTDDLTFCDGVLASVLRYDIVCYVENERRLWRALEVPQGDFDVDEAQHLVWIDLRVYVGAFQVGVKRLFAWGEVLYTVDQGIEARHKREERLSRPLCCGDDLLYREGAPRVAVLPPGDLVEDVAFYVTVPLVDGRVRVFLGQALFPMPFAPANAETMLLRLRFVEIHQRGEVFIPVSPEMSLFRAGRQVGGLEPVLDGLGGELVAEHPIESVGEGGQERQGDTPLAH